MLTGYFSLKADLKINIFLYFSINSLCYFRHYYLFHEIQKLDIKYTYFLKVKFEHCQQNLLKSIQKTTSWGFPGGAVVENLPANAGYTGSSPGLGRSHMPRSDQAREPQLLILRICSLCSATGEAGTVRGPRTAMKSGPHLPQLEKALAQKRRPNTAINK